MLSEIFFYAERNDVTCSAQIKLPENLYSLVLNAMNAKSPPKQELRLKISDYSKTIKQKLRIAINQLSALCTSKETWNAESAFELRQAMNLLLLFDEEKEYNYFSF